LTKAPKLTRLEQVFVGKTAARRWKRRNDEIPAGLKPSRGEGRGKLCVHEILLWLRKPTFQQDTEERGPEKRLAGTIISYMKFAVFVKRAL